MYKPIDDRLSNHWMKNKLGTSNTDSSLLGESKFSVCSRRKEKPSTFNIGQKGSIYFALFVNAGFYRKFQMLEN
jgi:hypothetical protein